MLHDSLFVYIYYTIAYLVTYIYTVHYVSSITYMTVLMLCNASHLKMADHLSINGSLFILLVVLNHWIGGPYI